MACLYPIRDIIDILTPMQIRLKRLGIILVIVSVLLCALVVIVGLAWGRRADEILLLGVTLAVSVIPEGLVAVVTITMAIGVRRMAARDAIVRKLSSVETLGSVTVICSDKTGTLTEGKMTAEEVWTTNERSYRLTNESAKAKGDPSAGSVTLAVKVVAITPTVAGATPSSPTASSATVLPKDIDQLPLHLVASSMVCALCNNSNIALDDDGKTWKFVGDPTEIALLVAANKAGLSRDYWAAQHGTKKLGEFAFDSDRKLMSALYDMSAVTNSRLRVPVIGLAKGAPEALLARCTSYLAADATDFATGARPLSDAHMETIAAQSTRMASSGLRVLGLAMRILPSVDEAQRIIASADSSLSETELTFIGLIGMIDPPRVGVKESVATCKKAGRWWM